MPVLAPLSVNLGSTGQWATSSIRMLRCRATDDGPHSYPASWIGRIELDKADGMGPDVSVEVGGGRRELIWSSIWWTLSAKTRKTDSDLSLHPVSFRTTPTSLDPRRI